MRWIFFSLLLANIGVYVWHSVTSERQARLAQLNASVAASATVQGRPLVLVSELSEEEKTELIKRPRQEASASLVVPVLVPEPPVEEATQPDQEETPEPETVPVVAAPAVVPNQCLILGPVSDKQYDQITQRLLARAIVPERLILEAKGASEYWVILPPFEDEKAAVRKLQEIQGRGIQGQIVAKGELANAISFGDIFSRQVEAEQLAEKIRAKGLKVEVRVLPQTRQEKWVSLSERQTPKFSDELWQEISQDFPRLRKDVRRCR